MNGVNRVRKFMVEEKKVYGKNFKDITENGKFVVMVFYGLILTFSAFFFTPVDEIFSGIGVIVRSPSILITDYISLANMGAAFFNSGLLMLMALVMVRLNKVHLSGPVIAAVFIIPGFGFFGKNIFNIWPILLGVFLYSRIQKDKFSKYIVLSFFATALSPLTSQISFGFNLNPYLGIFLGIIAGVLIGLVIIPIANHFVMFHQGFNLYNVGFTAGILGSLSMALLRSFGLDTKATLVLSEGNNQVLSLYFGLMFLSMIIFGWLFNERSFRNYDEILKSSGRLVTDFVTKDGFGITLVNMGALGLITTLYVLMVGGELSGIVIGGIITVMGFGAFGKQPKNILPIMLGVYLSSLLNIGEADGVAYLAAALFGTALAPIAGTYGTYAGIVAGFLHSSLVMTTGYLHGGLNLYNNGFSCGIVAAVMVPVLEAFKRENRYEA